MRKSQYFKLLLFFTAGNIFGTFSGSVLPVHYLESGVTMTQMAIGQLIIFATHSIALLIIRQYRAKMGFYLSTILGFVQLLFVVHIQSIWQFYLSSVIAGITIHLLYTAYNYAHFSNTKSGNVGVSSGIMFSIPRIIGVVLPLVAGYIIGLNITILWLLSGILAICTLFTIPALDDFQMNYSLKKMIQSTKSVRLFLIYEGIWSALIFAIIPIYTLTFIHKPESFGIFIAYIGLAGFIANMVLGKLTDRLKKRSVFLYPVTIILAVITYAFPYFQSSLWGWLIIAGLTTFFTPMFWNLTCALVIDNTDHHDESIPGRELFLDIGRLIGLSATVVSFIYESQPTYIFLFLGTAMICFFLNLVIQRISGRYTYL